MSRHLLRSQRGTRRLADGPIGGAAMYEERFRPDAPQLFQDIQAKCRPFQDIQAKCRQNPAGPPLFQFSRCKAMRNPSCAADRALRHAKPRSKSCLRSVISQRADFVWRMNPAPIWHQARQSCARLCGEPASHLHLRHQSTPEQLCRQSDQQAS
jgi:hypothetical protein